MALRMGAAFSPTPAVNTTPSRPPNHRLLNRAFHGAIHDMARSPDVARLSSALWDRSDFYVRTAFGAFRISARVREGYARISKAILARDADAILVTYAKLPGELLRQLTRCKAIGRFGLGVDNIDLPAAKECGIAVNYVTDYCLREVSDHAMALLLALARKVTFSNKLVQSGRWEVPPIVPLRRLEGQVLGLVGFGNIPRTLAPKAKGFGLQVITYDPYVVQVHWLSPTMLTKISSRSVRRLRERSSASVPSASSLPP